ncbi:AraC family transcriptional regulator [Superficieibacter sp. 1612_C1]|uniref:AraC family transcriptional regulator n=1 Tax=Superficieibacter sp. 1612_C1 TaxID=2780382 RepID=UPI0018844D2A|nr:AraC family transcriptional regulator [Superficieibacter sp. 1612_C1]
MDPFSDILSLLSARSYATAGLSAGHHWHMAFPGFNGLKFIYIRKGAFWFRPEAEPEWTRMEAGTGVILTRSARFMMATDVTCPPEESPEKKRPRVRETVNYGGEDNLLLAGKMEIDSAASDLLLQDLPLVLRFDTYAKENSSLSTLMTLLFNEKVSEKPGASQACDHLMHLIMIEVLRNGMENSRSGDGVLTSYTDIRINKVLRALHHEPEKKWCLSEMATIAGISRAGFSRKFKDTTGLTPLLYLTNWRMRLAGKSLRHTRESVKLIAFKLGYHSESTFSTAFKRVYGVAPRLYRDQHLGSPDLTGTE